MARRPRLAGRRRTAELRFPRWRDERSGGGRHSLWVQQALARETPGEATILQSGRRADVCIVGGGFTGLWTAIRLRELEPGVRVALLEADLCGTGASGRNSGAASHWWGKLPTLTKLLGDDDGKAVVRASVEAIQDLHAFCAAYAIDCEIRQRKSVWSATSTAQAGAWMRLLETAAALGLSSPYRELTSSELHELLPGGPHVAGVVDERATRVQPAALARGLRRVAIEAGVEVFERSPVRSVRSDAGGVRVSTAAGELDAERVVLAANAWMAHLAELRGPIMVVSSDVIATEPVPDALPALGLDRAWGFNSRMMVNYYSASPDQRVVVGRGGGTLAPLGRIGRPFARSRRQAREVAADLRFLFPALAGARITHAWAGPVDRSGTGLPWFTHLRADDRILYGVGYSGHGVGASILGGRILAAKALGRDDEWAVLGDSLNRIGRQRFPPEPLRTGGGLLVRRAVGRKEAAKSAGHRPHRIDAALAQLAPATMNDIRRRST